MLTIVFFAIQALSLAVAILFIVEYKRIAKKHIFLLDAIDSGKKPSCVLQSTIIIWLYVLLTLGMIGGSTALFYFEKLPFVLA